MSLEGIQIFADHRGAMGPGTIPDDQQRLLQSSSGRIPFAFARIISARLKFGFASRQSSANLQPACHGRKAEASVFVDDRLPDFHARMRQQGLTQNRRIASTKPRNHGKMPGRALGRKANGASWSINQPGTFARMPGLESGITSLTPSARNSTSRCCLPEPLRQ